LEQQAQLLQGEQGWDKVKKWIYQIARLSQRQPHSNRALEDHSREIKANKGGLTLAHPVTE